MSTVESELVISLNKATYQINRSVPIAILLFGTLGNILNILVLSQRNLRSNPCGWFFLMSSIAHLICLVSGLPSRILAGWKQDLTETVGSLCKLRAYLVFSSRNIAFWLIMFATIDRWLSSCFDSRLRRLSSVKNARISTMLIIIISLLLYSNIIYCYEANQIDSPLLCYGKNDLCRHFHDAIYLLISILLPILLMMGFGLMTISNVRQSENRKRQLNHRIHVVLKPQHNKQRHIKTIDHHLLKVLLIQIVLLSLFTLPQAIQKLYATLTNSSAKSNEIVTVDRFTYGIAVLLTFTASGTPFYIYTLFGGSVFRKALCNIVVRRSSK